MLAGPIPGRLHDRVAIITGGSRGFGLAVARAFSANGADVLICARDNDRLQDARESLSRHAAGRRVVAVRADVTRDEDAAEVMATAIGVLGRVDILVSNAGVHGPIGAFDDVDAADWYRAIDVNLGGPMRMFRAVLPTFRAQGHGKIIQLSGGGATEARPRFSAYAVSKTAVVRLVETLAVELRGTGVELNSIAPGAMDTDLIEEIVRLGPEGAGAKAYEEATRVHGQGGKTLTDAVDLAVFLASTDSNGISGRLISAHWDGWQHLAELATELDPTDIYQLRRIVPRDRGLNWDQVRRPEDSSP
jgi:NAD(P)-dependent dehydrogenase (short-subunit alcohol dehydrogenase family)